MKKRTRFSIITVVKNDHKKIEKTIKSVNGQSYKNYEHILIDGKSTDGTVDIIKKYKKKISYFSSKKDKNLWDGMNNGIKNSKGEIIFILNSGDLIFKNALKIADKYFKKLDIDFLFGAIKKDRIFYKFEPEKINYRLNIYPSHSGSFFIKSKKQRELGYYDTNFDYCADYDLFLRMIKEKKFNGTSTKKNELIGKFDMKGISSKIPFYKHYFYEMRVRKKNGQNIIYLIFLYLLKIINKFRNYFINLFLKLN